MTVRAFVTRTLRSVLDWFWSTPTTGASAALFRMLFGALSLWTAFGMAINLDRYYGAHGMAPWSLVKTFTYVRWSLIAIAPESHAWLVFLVTAFFLASLTFTLGIYSRISAALMFVLTLSFFQRSPWLLNGGDRVFVILCGLSVGLPRAPQWSLSRLWSKPGSPRVYSTVGQRLLQLQIAYVYAAAGLAKLAHARWWSGRALRDVWATPVYAEWPTYVDFWPLVYAATWGTLLFELAFPSLVWFKRLRRPMIVAGVLFHLFIEISMTLPMFSAVMVVSYALFLTDEDAAWLLRAGRRRTATSRDVASLDRSLARSLDRSLDQA